jgi:hypothetical protein
MLTAAGFAQVRVIDLTTEYRDSVHRLIREQDRRADELKGALGHERLEERQRELRGALGAIEAGLLKRSLFVAERGV